MENAIKKSIEGGYNFPKSFDSTYMYFHLNRVLLDPLFWQALGKALGWKELAKINVPEFARWGQKEIKISEEMRQAYSLIKWPEWRYYLHRFIDHLIDGKDIDSFFTPLLPDSK